MAITQIPVGTPTNFYQYTDTAMGATADAVKNSATTLYWIQVNNSGNASASYVKLYNAASGSVTVGTTAPDECIYVPAGLTVIQQYNQGNSPGKIFGTALTACCVTTGGTAGTTAPSSSVSVTLAYV